MDLKEIGSKQVEERIEEDASDVEDTNTFQQLTKALNQTKKSQQQYEKFFKPNVKLCLAIGNYDYKVVRNEYNRGFGDLPAAKDDVDYFAAKILEFGFEPENVIKLENVNQKEMMKNITQLSKTLN